MIIKICSCLSLYILLLSISIDAQPEYPRDPWNNAAAIVNSIVVPEFKDADYFITAFGAVGDGITDCTDAFKKTIEACASNGGGRVVVTEGVFLTGPIHLLSKVNLMLEKNAVIRFSTNPDKYLPVVFTRWEGVECMNYSPLIYAYNQENIAITGSGILDGQGDNSNWWSWKGNKNTGWSEGMPDQKKGRKMLFESAENNIPPEERILGKGYYLRPNFFQPYQCKNILIEGVTFKNSPMWFLHPVLCENITLNSVNVEGLGPNNDGFDPESSKNILVKNCYFNTGDDCIAIKSGRNNDGRRINTPSENIVIQDCKMKEGHGGIVIGSEISGGVRNVFAENCIMSSPNLERAVRIKTNAVRGGVIENLFVRNLIVGEVSEAVLKINFYYEEGDHGAFTPEVRNIHLSDITSQKSSYAVWIKAYERSPVRNLRLNNCTFNDTEYENIIQNVEGLKASNVIINGRCLNVDQEYIRGD